MALTEQERLRYNRQIMIPDIGEAGQEKIKKARVLVAGLGGLGSVSCYYLAAAGIGSLRIVDRDRVELSNLNRQIIHGTENLGEPKPGSAQRKLQNQNPHCAVEAVEAEIGPGNCGELAEGCQVIVDALDSMATRRILNAIALEKRIPYVYGGVHELDGMASTFVPGQTPCLECVFPNVASASGAAPPGILGPVPGVIASIQAIETVKLILGMPGCLTGRLLCFCGFDMTFREFKILRHPECPACGGIAISGS